MEYHRPFLFFGAGFAPVSRIMTMMPWNNLISKITNSKEPTVTEGLKQRTGNSHEDSAEIHLLENSDQTSNDLNV